MNGTTTNSPADEAYLDNAATTRTRPEAIERMNEVMRDAWGNPSSVHAAGRRAKAVLEEARADVADVLGVDAHEVYFTSGATESNNLVVRGTCSARRDKPGQIVTSTLEHASVTRSVRGMRREGGWEVSYIDAVGGKLGLDQLRGVLDGTPTTLITIMNVQNEVGYIFPSAEIGRIRDELAPGAVYHVDATQALGKLPVSPREWHADLVSVASHKIGGPRGIGALYVREGLKMHTNAFGGGQEGGLRSGTEPVFLAAGFACAVKLAVREREQVFSQVEKLNARARERLAEAVPGIIVNSPADASPFILSVSVPGVRNSKSVAYLSDRGVYVSRASACESNHEHIAKGTWRPKHPLSLQAAGIPLKQGNTTLRASFCATTTEADVDRFVDVLASCVQELGEGE